MLLLLNFPTFDKMRGGQSVISVVELKQRFFTGLQVTSDPGVWLVYTGFIIMILGCYITFFAAHQQFYIERRYKFHIIGAFATPLAFLALAYASLSPNNSSACRPIVWRKAP